MPGRSCGPSNGISSATHSNPTSRPIIAAANTTQQTTARVPMPPNLTHQGVSMHWFQPAYWRDRGRAPFPWVLVGLIALALSPVVIVAVAVVCR